MVAAPTLTVNSKQERMALQLGHLVSPLLIISLLICLNFVLEVGGGIVYTHNHVNDHGQPAIYWNNTSHDQEHKTTQCPLWKYHKINTATPAVCVELTSTISSIVRMTIQ